tara:strand:- start:375 stop:1250 length:876 start_codon:yes stop_codon:yes gene_type:complete
MATVVHVDADILVYSAGFATERRFYSLTAYDPDFNEYVALEFQYKAEVDEFIESPSGAAMVDHSVEQKSEAEPLSHAIKVLELMVKRIATNLEVSDDDIVMHLTGKTNFRKEIATIKPYKGNRKDTAKPVHFTGIQQAIKDRWTTLLSVDEEADDTMGYHHYKAFIAGEDSIICTIDKDLDMIPGKHYNFRKSDLYYVDEQQAEQAFYEQLLKGDTTDNIVGVKGVGAAKAQKALSGTETIEEMEAVVGDMYRKGYGEDWYDALIENGRLLWIRRTPGEMWQPTYIKQGDK